MTFSIDFLSSPFRSEYVSSSKNKKSMFGTFKGQNPFQFVASKTHYLFLNAQRQLYGFGSNAQHQLSSKKLSLFTLPIKVNFVTSKILEIACGEDFSAVLTDKQEIEIFGCQKSKIQKKNIRGLSASNKTIAFAYKTDKVYIGTIENTTGKSKDRKKSEIKNTTYKLPHPILKTAINDYSVAALDQNGNVYIHEFESDSFTQIDHLYGLSISSSHDSITILNKRIIYVFNCQSKRITSHYLPSNFKPIFACSSFSDIFALSDDGRVLHGTTNDKELTITTYSKQYRSISNFKLDPFNSVSAISMTGSSIVFIKGSPDQFNYEFQPEITPIQCGTRVQTVEFDDTFICCTDKTAYFKSSTVPYSKLPTLLSFKHVGGSIFYTAAQEPIELTNDLTVLRPFNLSIGATIQLKRKMIKIGDNSEDEDDSPLFEIVGCKEGQIWVRPFNSGYVVCLPPDVRDFNEKFEIKGKLSDTFKNWFVDGYSTTYDLALSSIENAEYSIGDLIWHPLHGIVEVVGSKDSLLVLLEFCNRTLFTQEAVEMKILRKSENNESDSKSGKSQKKSKKSKAQKYRRKVVDINGEVISLDISSGNGPRAFLPTDRVLSPLGEATVLGFKEAPYIQTDEMRMNGYEAVMINVFDLKLIRRINGVAVRTVSVSKSSSSSTREVRVSLNTEDSPNGLLPGDKIQVCDKYATVVGFCEEDDHVLTVIQYKGSKNCVFLEHQFTIIYRADINAIRKSVMFPPAFVGSPLIQESSYLPGDVVYNKAIGEAFYLGYSKNQAMFLQTKNSEILTFGFSMLLTSKFFQIVHRPVLDFWSDDKKD